MSDNEELRERLRRVTGDVYGDDADAAEIAHQLKAEHERWQTIAEIEQERGAVSKLGQGQAQWWAFEDSDGLGDSDTIADELDNKEDINK